MKRKSNFELLRIISMLFILFHHFYYSYITLDYSQVTINQFGCQILYSLGKIGVNLFILITGYFLINSKFKIKKVFTIYLQTIFYSWIILLVYMCIATSISIKEFVKSILPIVYNSYWFVTNYLILYCLSTFLNKFIHNINQKQYEVLLLILVIIWCFIPTFMFGKINFSEIDWFILMYMIGAYIRLYSNKFFENNKIVRITLVLFSCISVLSICLLDKFFYLLKIDPLHFAMPMNQFIPFVISVCLFLVFKNMDIKDSNIINKIASTTLGIYLIHANKYVNELIWKHIFKVNIIINSKYLILYEILAVFSVFIVCMIIDFIRQYIFKKSINRFIDFITLKIENKFKLVEKAE